MAEPYLTELKTIISRLGVLNTVSCRHFFSGAAAYTGDHIFMSLSPVGLALKLGQEDCNRLFDRGATPLKYFPKAPIKKGYVVLPAQLVEDEKELSGWIKRSMEFVLN